MFSRPRAVIELGDAPGEHLERFNVAVGLRSEM
jgi:hypothetical protein